MSNTTHTIQYVAEAGRLSNALRQLAEYVADLPEAEQDRSTRRLAFAIAEVADQADYLGL